MRIGEAAASRTPADVLACIGLGSCVALALVDRTTGVAGLAHVMLPADPAGSSATNPFKFANLAVPALLALVLAHGALRSRSEAVLVGGAAMFQFGGSAQDIGARNEAAVRHALATLGLPVVASETGGGKGRTVRITVGRDLTVRAREAGGSDQHLLGSPARTEAVAA